MVSVIIPVYNAELFLGEAIESIRRQTYREFEIIVVDDGSTDDTRKVAESFGGAARYYYQPNAGSGVARNLGIDLSDGDFLAFLDADDCWTSDKLELEIAAFDENPALDAVFGQVRQVLDGEWKSRILETGGAPGELIAGCVPGTMLIRRASFLRVGYFPTDYKLGESLDWYLRAREIKLAMKILPELMLWRRVHTLNHSYQHRAAAADYVRIVKQSLDRRRLKNDCGE